MRAFPDTFTWLLPFWRALAADPGLHRLAPEDQMKLLVFRVAQENATEAAKLEALTIFEGREVLRQLRERAAEPACTESEVLWQVQRDDRVLTCESCALPHGTDLRLVENGDFRRTQLVRSEVKVRAAADEWLAKLEAAGWTRRASP